MRLFAAALVAAFLFLLFTFPVAAQDFHVAAVGRLKSDRGRGCTAFLIKSELVPTHASRDASMMYRNIFISAGHCFAFDLHFQSNPYKFRSPNRTYEWWVGADEFNVTVVAFANTPGQLDYLVGYFWSYYLMPTLPISYEEPQIGEKLLIIGYPLRTLGAIVGTYQGRDEQNQMVVNALGQFGYSGSPMLNSSGEVVGIAAALKLDIPPEQRGNPYYCFFGGCKRIPPMYGTSLQLLREILR